MLKIHQIVIIKILGLLGGMLVLSSLLSYVVLKSIVIEHNKRDLEHTISVAEIDISKIDDLDAYVAKIAQTTSLRVTIIDADGVVIAESEADKKTMENHANRYEVLQANQEKFSWVVRYSKTVSMDYLYVAKKSSYRGKNIYIRMSLGLVQVMEDFYALWSRLLLVFLFIMLIGFYISKQMSERIVYDIRQITRYLDEISNKNYNAIIKTKYFYEFLQISLMLKNLVKKLSNRDKQKRKYTAKLRLMNKQRNDILSAISHEFKNPVASIMGYAQTLQDDMDVDSKIREKFLGKIVSNADKISLMLDRLALSVKLENNDLDLNQTEVNLSELLQEVATNLKSKYKNRNIELVMQPCTVYADKNMMEIVINNLLDNALKYSERDVRVELTSEKFCVIDQGIGIQQEYLDKVTSKFYRIHKNSWDNSMGLGLAMVSYILKRHKSFLEIESVYAEGSKFCFSLENMRKK